MRTFDLLTAIRQMSDEVAELTGYTAYHYTSQPENRPRIVFTDRVVSSVDQAMAHMQSIVNEVRAGSWSDWRCRICAWQFDTEEDRDDHELGAHGCHSCGRTFTSGTRLRVHLDGHAARDAVRAALG